MGQFVGYMFSLGDIWCFNGISSLTALTGSISHEVCRKNKNQNGKHALHYITLHKKGSAIRREMQLATHSTPLLQFWQELFLRTLHRTTSLNPKRGGGGGHLVTYMQNKLLHGFNQKRLVAEHPTSRVFLSTGHLRERPTSLSLKAEDPKNGGFKSEIPQSEWFLDLKP